MAKIDYIQTIRYMGNKSKLLDYIVPEIENITQPGDTICDIMAGTNSIGYALKRRNKIVSNDFEYYSYVIAKCMLNNYSIPSSEEMHNDLDTNIKKNKDEMIYSFFKENYTDTYFAEHQCVDIDSIRFAISKVSDENKKYFYLTLLMNSMCKAQSTTGHFAQYMNKDHERIIPLRNISVLEMFYDKRNDFNEFATSIYDNINFNWDYKELFKNEIMNTVSCFYLDSPYTSDQYSRFYHILETVCLYDNPVLKYKAKYRTDRKVSDFCYKKNVANEFENIIKFTRSKNAKLVISYSNRGVISIDEISNIAKKYYSDVVVKYIDFEHSSQGKGTIDIKEVIIVLK